jgi:hypothetical protein
MVNLFHPEVGRNFYLMSIVFGVLGLGGVWRERFLWKKLAGELH